MEEPQPDDQQEKQAEPPKISKMAAIYDWWVRSLHRTGGVLRLLGFFAFMAFLPMLILAYPAYLTGVKLLDFESAGVVEAKLQRIEIRTVENNQDAASVFEARKHIDVVFYFKDDAGKDWAAVSDYEWPAPGLKRKLESRYQISDIYALYMMPDQSILIDQDVAVERFNRMTLLMALLFLSGLLSALLWVRLHQRYPESVPAFPPAITYSVLSSQVLALLIAGLFAWVNSKSPLIVPVDLYLVGYWGLVALLTLSLRLLLFSPPQAPAPAAVPAEDDRPARVSRPASNRG